MPPKRNMKKNKSTKAKIPKKYVPRKQSEQSITKVVNKVLRKKAEVKHYDRSYELYQLYHNNYTLTNGSFIKQLVGGGSGIVIPQGTGENSMVGTEVNIIGTMLKLMFLVKADRMNTKFRVLIVRHPSGYNISSSYNQLFDNLTNNALVDGVDRHRVNVLYDKIHGYKNIVPNNSTDEVTFFKTIIVPKQKYKLAYTDNGDSTANIPKFVDTLIVIAYDTFGTLLTDNIGAVLVNQRTYFTDM